MGTNYHPPGREQPFLVRCVQGGCGQQGPGVLGAVSAGEHGSPQAKVQG